MRGKEVRQCRKILAKLSAREMAKKQNQSTLTPLIITGHGGNDLLDGGGQLPGVWRVTARSPAPIGRLTGTTRQMP